MSRENVQTVHALADLWNAGEHGADELGRYFDHDVELESPLSSVVGVPYRGHAGIEQWTRDLDEQFSSWHLSVDDVHDLGDRVMTIGRVQGRGRASGIEIDFPAAVLASFLPSGTIARVRIYSDVKEALGAAGLTE